MPAARAPADTTRLHPRLPCFPLLQLAFLQELQGPEQPPVALIGHSIGAYMQHHALYRLEGSAAAVAEDEARVRALDVLAAEDEAGTAPGGEQPRSEELLSMAEREQHRVRQRQPADSDDDRGGDSGRARTSNVRLVISVFPFLQLSACLCCPSLLFSTGHLSTRVCADDPLALQVDPSSGKQAALRRLTASHRLLARAAAGLSLLPGAVKRSAVRLFDRNMDPHAVATAAEMVHPATGEGAGFESLFSVHLH